MRPGPVFLSNRAGGILGGVSTGETIVARFALKPTSSIPRPPAHDRYGRRGGRRGDQGAARPLRGDPRRPGGRGDGRACSRRPPAAPARPSRAPRAGGVRDGAMGGHGGHRGERHDGRPLCRALRSPVRRRKTSPTSCASFLPPTPTTTGAAALPPTPGTCACASPSISTLRPASRPSSPARSPVGSPAAAPIAVGYALYARTFWTSECDLAVLLKRDLRSGGAPQPGHRPRSHARARPRGAKRRVPAHRLDGGSLQRQGPALLPPPAGGARPVQAHAHHRRGRLRTASPPGRRLCARPCAGPGCAR